MAIFVLSFVNYDKMINSIGDINGFGKKESVILTVIVLIIFWPYLLYKTLTH